MSSGLTTGRGPAGTGDTDGGVVSLRRTWTRIAGRRSTRPSARIPLALAALAVACQIVYPLVSGSVRDVITVVTVLLFSAASLSHALLLRGVRTAAAVFAVFVGGGLAVEALGIATGFPFGTYEYSTRLGPQIADVPVVIPLAWSMIGYPALVVARRITAQPLAGVAMGGLALATWDLFLDPQMVTEGYWTWAGSGPNLIGTIPVTNYVAWLGTALVMMALLWPATRGWDATDDDRGPVALYLWTWLGSTMAHLAFFGLWQSGLYGGIGMGIVCVSLLRATRTVDVTASRRTHTDARTDGRATG